MLPGLEKLAMNAHRKQLTPPAARTLAHASIGPVSDAASVRLVGGRRYVSALHAIRGSEGTWQPSPGFMIMESLREEPTPDTHTQRTRPVVHPPPPMTHWRAMKRLSAGVIQTETQQMDPDRK